MKAITYSPQKSDVAPDEAIKLYLSVGWGKEIDYTVDQMQNAIDNTDILVSAKGEDGKLLGLVRCLTDHQYFTVIADIVVAPGDQHRELGREMLQIISKSMPGKSIYAPSLQTSIGFFEKCGYKKSSMQTLVLKDRSNAN